MTQKKKKNPIDEKAKLIEQLKEIETKIADFDKQRALRVGNLAKQHRLIDLADDILEKEFLLIRDKYKGQAETTSSQRDDGKKNS